MTFVRQSVNSTFFNIPIGYTDNDASWDKAQHQINSFRSHFRVFSSFSVYGLPLLMYDIY